MAGICMWSVRGFGTIWSSAGRGFWSMTSMGHKLVKRIATPASLEEKPDNIKGVCACAATQRLYFTTTKKLYCVDLVSEKTLWKTEPVNGTDRMSITPDGRIIYVPSFEKDTWNVIDGKWGHIITSIETKSGAHNT